MSQQIDEPEVSSQSDSNGLEGLWRLLVEPPARLVRLLEGPGRDWRAELELALTEHDAEKLIVVARRSPLYAIGALLRGRPLRHAPLSKRRIRSFVKGMGEVEAIYDLWPTASDPVVGFDASRPRLGEWAHWIGAVGIGGRSIWIRALLRSRPLLPLLRALTPAVAIVVRPVNDRGTDD